MGIDRFGETRAGQPVDRVILSGGGLTVSILTLGTILQDVRLTAYPDLPLTVGSPDLSAYDGGSLASAGALVGPIANRIAGARCRLDDQDLTFEANARGGHHLHSGTKGLSHRVWEIVSHSADRLVLETRLANGAAGLPGNRRIRATWQLGPGALGLDLWAESDAPTLMNLANHSYWTLGLSLDVLHLELDADRYLPADADALVTGEIASVAGTRYDFRAGRTLTPSDALDTCFCLADAPRDRVRVCRLAAPNGRKIELETTAPGLQAFTADGYEGRGAHDHLGQPIGHRFGLALEPQLWPDAPNHPAFPSIRLEEGTAWHQSTRWRFT